ncbi:hypothetical protein NQ317_015419 [Molorchus minor]|uniref:Uncharacterized protein n=1 Tax=Molorchus minor TaxID=1323400 RepID=A0ABQ9IWV4_9CUCU|nr:hypothetical protein NQ317_015419 [Molorchus minor]
MSSFISTTFWYQNIVPESIKKKCVCLLIAKVSRAVLLRGEINKSTKCGPLQYLDVEVLNELS